MQIIGVTRMGGVGSVEPDDIKIVIFDPNPSREQSFRRRFFRLDINDYAPHVSQKLSPNKRKIVIVLLKVRIKHHHLGKSAGHEPTRENADKRVEEMATDTGMSIL